MDVIKALGVWNYVIFATMVFVEGPTATLIGATAAGSGRLEPLAVFLVAAGSNLMADSFWYYLGRWGHEARILHWVEKVGVDESMLEQAKRKMHQHALKILLAAKLTLSFSIPALIVAGLTRISWRKTILVLLGAEILWSGSLVLAGVYLGQWLERLEKGIQVVTILGSIVFLLILMVFVKRIGKRHFVDDDIQHEDN